MIVILIVHFAVTCALVGLVWTVQIVHYPLFKEVGNEEFKTYHKLHVNFISWLVIPLMVAELGSAAWLYILGERSVVFWISLAALALIWLSTWVFQVPLHHKLSQGYDARAIQGLVLGNILRTIGWTVRGVCAAVLLYGYAA